MNMMPITERMVPSNARFNAGRVMVYCAACDEFLGFEDSKFKEHETIDCIKTLSDRIHDVKDARYDDD